MEQPKKYNNVEILKTDTEGNPIIGKYTYGQEQQTSESLKEVDIPLTEEEERSAQNVAVVKASAWIKEHPNYTMDQLSKAKAEFLEEARNSFHTARAKNTDTNGNH